MRAGLLSDPRVVALLQQQFIPCLSSACNTADRIDDPADVACLAAYAASSGEGFVGGEREAFVLPDGTMLDVFLSLRDGQVASHATAAARRSERAVRPFRAHAEQALQRLLGELPADWASYWDGTAAAVQRVAAAAPRWPEPAGAPALRVFVRNGADAYDDLHGCELFSLAERDLLGGAALAVPGARVAVPAEVFRDLVRAMVPRGGVDGRLQDESIDGELAFVVEQVEAGVARGRIEGRVEMRPTRREENGRRPNAARLFIVDAAIVGRFAFDGNLHRFRSLRFATDDAEFREWSPLRPAGTHPALPYAVGVEWLPGAAAPATPRRRG